MECFTTSFHNIAKHPTLRADFGYRLFFDVRDGKTWENCNIELRFLASKVKSSKISKGNLDEEEQLIDLSNIARRINIIDPVSVSEIGSDKTVIENGDIVIPKIQPKNGNIFTNENHDRYICSSELVEYKCNEYIRPKFLFYLLTSSAFSKSLSLSEGGKTHPRVNPDEILRYRIPLISLDKQDEFLAVILPLEDKISELYSQIASVSDLINDVLINCFSFDFDTFDKIRGKKSYVCAFHQLSNNYDLRYSAKFHRPAGEFLLEFLRSKTPYRLKNFISEPIILGASVSPSDFSSSGEFYFISMASIKKHKVETDETQLLSPEYMSKEKNSKKKLQKGDIIMSRSGVAIGKFALVEDEIQGIFADFTMRIRLNDNINKLFAYYYFRSVFTQYLIEINKKGLQNQNIFPNQIQEFPFPNLSMDEQQAIIDKVKDKIELQEQLKRKISDLRNVIEEHLFVAIGIS